jgi:hypothetical protein
MINVEPVGVRASKAAIAAMREMSIVANPDPSAPPGFPPELLTGLPVYLDPELPPGKWRFVYREELPPLMARLQDA